MPITASRQRALRNIITNSAISSQSGLVQALRRAGHDVTQATVSRDLAAVGAIKARDAEGALRYQLSSELSSADEDQEALGRTLAEHVESMKVSGNLVVLRTPPGAAHVVAFAIDIFGLRGTIGTVAGDDTMLVIADEETGGRSVLKELERLGDMA
jgi:transcriptional regulator of arginine metabolism